MPLTYNEWIQYADLMLWIFLCVAEWICLHISKLLMNNDIQFLLWIYITIIIIIINNIMIIQHVAVMIIYDTMTFFQLIILTEISMYPIIHFQFNFIALLLRKSNEWTNRPWKIILPQSFMRSTRMCCTLDSLVGSWILFLWTCDSLWRGVCTK